MKLKIIAGLLLALLLSVGATSKAGAQEWRWHRWSKCGYALCKEDTMDMSKHCAGCHYCHSCCFHRGWGWGWGWGWRHRCCGDSYYYESLHKECHHECTKEDDKKCSKDCHDGHRYYHHGDRCCDDRYYYRGGGY